MRKFSIRRPAGLAARVVVAAFVLAVVSACSEAASRTATTAVGVRVERHAGVVIPSTGSSFAPTSFPGPRFDEPRAFGNGAPALTARREPAAVLRTSARSSDSVPRVELIVFEP